MTGFHSRWFRRTALAVAVIFAFVQLPLGPASAELIGTEQMISQERVGEARSTIDQFMARDDVRAELERQGVDPIEAERRAAALSDAEAVDLAQKIEEAPAGAGVGAVIGAVVLIFLVLLITDILGFTSVFGFTQKGSARP